MQAEKEISAAEKELLALAESMGFLAAVLPVEEVPVDGRFRAYCEENICGRYNANYSCPPDCGSVEALHNTLLREETALIVETRHGIESYENKADVLAAKTAHNKAVLRLMEEVRARGYAGFCTGYNGCPLCEPCLRTKNLPCAHPKERISCMSAYCIDVAALAARCSLPFAWDPKMLHLFGMIALHKGKEN